MYRYYRIKDILYSNNGKGVEGTPKVGVKYDARRGRVYGIDLENYRVGDCLVFESLAGTPVLYTTPWCGVAFKNDGTMLLKTYNSTYVLECAKDWR